MGNCGSVDKQESPLKETIADHEGPINCMALSNDGTLLVTGSEDSTARMWSVTTPETDCLGVFAGHSSYVNAVAVADSDDEAASVVVLTGSADCTIRKWDAATCECVFVYDSHSARIQKMFVTGDVIVSSSYDSTIKVWSLNTAHIPKNGESEALLRTFEGHGKAVYAMIFIPEEVLASADENGNNEDGDSDEGSSSDLLISASADMTARAWNFDSTKCLRGHRGAITTMSVDSEGKTLFTAGADFVVISWVVATGAPIRTMEGHTQSILCMTVFNRLMYTGSADALAKCWTKDLGDCTKTYRGHKHSVICMKIEMGILFTGCGDGEVRAFNATNGQLRNTFSGHEGAVNCMVLVKDKIYTGASDCTLRVWDTKEMWDDAMYSLYEEPAPEAPVVTEAPTAAEDDNLGTLEEEEEEVEVKDEAEGEEEESEAQAENEEENDEGEDNVVEEDQKDDALEQDLDEILAEEEEERQE